MLKRISIGIFMLIFVILGVQVKIKADELTNVKDYLNYLQEDEKTNLQAEIDNIKSEYNLDAVIVITDNTEGKSSMEFADDYYDYNGYGVGSDYSGLLMLINMEQREVWISTTGRAIDIFTDSRISTMIKNITGYLADGKYYNASTIFLSDIADYASRGVPSGQHRVPMQQNSNLKPAPKLTYLQRVMRLLTSLVTYLIALAISVITTILASLSSKGKVTINNHTYEKQFSLRETRDDFIRQTVTKTKIERNTNTSSTHTGSSGRTHGGGGGKF